jgi:hypothetical protein
MIEDKYYYTNKLISNLEDLHHNATFLKEYLMDYQYNIEDGTFVEIFIKHLSGDVFDEMVHLHLDLMSKVRVEILHFKNIYSNIFYKFLIENVNSEDKDLCENLHLLSNISYDVLMYFQMLPSQYKLKYPLTDIRTLQFLDYFSDYEVDLQISLKIANIDLISEINSYRSNRYYKEVVLPLLFLYILIDINHPIMLVDENLLEKYKNSVSEMRLYFYYKYYLAWDDIYFLGLLDRLNADGIYIQRVLPEASVTESSVTEASLIDAHIYKNTFIFMDDEIVRKVVLQMAKNQFQNEDLISIRNWAEHQLHLYTTNQFKIQT